MGDRLGVATWILHHHRSAPARALSTARGDCTDHS